MIKFCLSCNQEYEAKTEDSKMCFTCFKRINNLRQIERNEIVIDIDRRDLQGCMCVSATGISLLNEGYHFELWYAQGQKQPHIHIKNIPHIADLTDTQLKEYKTLFLQKYIDKKFWEYDSQGRPIIPDYSICKVTQLIAEENKPHFKYKTIKLLRSEFNQDKSNFAETDLLEQAKQTAKEEHKPNMTGLGTSGTSGTSANLGITAKIIQAISIKDIAKQFGLTIHGSKCLCPFHADAMTESLVFYDKQGSFHCFGCNANGNIIKFYAMLKELKPDFVYKKVQQ